jgi:hypothetical protein
MASPDEIKAILTRHVAEFPGTTDDEKRRDLSETLPKVIAALSLPMDDRRAAAQLAIEAPKLFITMALALIVAIGALVQLGWNSFMQSNHSLWALLLLSGFGCFLSMYFGMLAINQVSKAGQQIDNRWTLASIRVPKNAQALIGVVAIVLFVIAVGISAREPLRTSGGAIMIELPGALQALLPKGIVASGNWSELRLDGGNGVRVDLDPVPAGQTRSFQIRSK